MIQALDLDGGDVSIVRTGANRATEVSVRGSAAGAFEVRSSGLVAVRHWGSDGSLKRSAVVSDSADLTQEVEYRRELVRHHLRLSGLS